MLTKEYALRHTWYQVRDDGSHPTPEIRLLPDGTIEGYGHPNEAVWKIDDGTLYFLGQDGNCSTIFSELASESGRLTLRGQFVRDRDGIVHRLIQLGTVLEHGGISYDSVPLDELGIKNGTDKSSRHHNYLSLYDRMISHLRRLPVRVLEIGVLIGDSIGMWHDYFEKGTIVGADLKMVSLERSMDRATLVTADQSNVEDLLRLGIEYGPFDLVVDDGSHLWNDQITTLRYLFSFLKPGGYYILEDIDTSYGTYIPEYKGCSSISASQYLQRLTDYVIADNALNLAQQEDPFIRTYAPLVEFTMFARRTSITRRRL